MLALPLAESVRIHPLDDTMKAQSVRFIESWNLDTVYDRFGTVGTSGQERLAFELTQHGRSALVAVHRVGVVGLLDHVYADGEIHMGIVVDWRFRRSSIGTRLVFALLASRTAAQPVAAECRIDNRPAVSLLRGCEFRRTMIDRHEIVWRHA
jgi:ribosomal protein S18 acetylase RimI-like enzyme